MFEFGLICQLSFKPEENCQFAGLCLKTEVLKVVKYLSTLAVEFIMYEYVGAGIHSNRTHCASSERWRWRSRSPLRVTTGCILLRRPSFLIMAVSAARYSHYNLRASNTTRTHRPRMQQNTFIALSIPQESYSYAQSKTSSISIC